MKNVRLHAMELKTKKISVLVMFPTIIHNARIPLGWKPSEHFLDQR